MTYEEFKLCIIQQAASTAHYPNVLNVLQQVVFRAGEQATANEILIITYNEYCRTHGITK